MAYEPTDWKNREVERPRTFTFQDNGDGTFTLIPAEGKVTEPGTPITAVNMNKIEQELVLLDAHASNKSNPHNVTTAQVNETLYNPLSTVPPLDYPRGLSMTVVTPEKGFPTWGTVLAVRGSSPSGALQIFTPHDMSLGKTLLIRRGNGNINEWLGWGPIGVTDTGWISATEGPNWALPSGGFLQYRKVGDLVYVRGKIMGMNSIGSIITTLPAGYRPRSVAYIASAGGHILVTSAGAMFAGGNLPANQDINFDGVYSVA